MLERYYPIQNCISILKNCICQNHGDLWAWVYIYTNSITLHRFDLLKECIYKFIGNKNIIAIEYFMFSLFNIVKSWSDSPVN